MKKLGLFVAAAAVAALGISAPAAAATPVYPPEGGTLVITPNPATPGANVTVTFFGCQLGEVVVFEFEWTDALEGACNGPAGALFVSAATGPSASVEVTAPTEPGTYDVSATGLLSGASAAGTLTVAVAATPGGGLPSTGSDAIPVVQIGAGLVAVGTGLAVVAGLRRRKVTAA